MVDTPGTHLIHRRRAPGRGLISAAMRSPRGGPDGGAALRLDFIGDRGRFKASIRF